MRDMKTFTNIIIIVVVVVVVELSSVSIFKTNQ